MNDTARRVVCQVSGVTGWIRTINVLGHIQGLCQLSYRHVTFRANWWRWRDSNPRPETFPNERLHACPLSAADTAHFRVARLSGPSALFGAGVGYQSACRAGGRLRGHSERCGTCIECDRVLSWPLGQPRHAIRSSSVQSIPVHPQRKTAGLPESNLACRCSGVLWHSRRRLKYILPYIVCQVSSQVVGLLVLKRSSYLRITASLRASRSRADMRPASW